ncbi:methyltransferase-like protein 25B [Galleria mellonella]|uniref:Methyltransferase-like protein 25B n=1 Tax=Galleria mellonella TaxID=7137 RepID=A0A6J3CEV6_GALME|nr:methyltransferase-like protein 25B [Galleria mellonella]
MSLPNVFDKSENYFEECLTFFNEYQYLYSCANTDILVNNILEEIQVENLDDLDVFDKKFNLKDSEGVFLNKFFNKLERLSVAHNTFIDDSSLSETIDAPLSPKKKHEIIYLAKEIRDVCEESGCDTIVDFGSGLGYLDQRLFDISNYKILGIECNEGHYVNAKKRQRKYHENSTKRVKYIKHTINDDSHTNIQEYLQDKFYKCGAFCITGLHACADLTVTAINLFLKMADAKSMVLMSCCYHLMLRNNGRFRNFPLSNSLRVIFEERVSYQYISVPFLRLGAQPPHFDDNLEEMVFNLLARSALQLYANTHNCQLRRNKRKAVKMKSVDKNFETYIQDASEGYTLIPNTCSDNENDDKNPESAKQFDFEKLREIWRQNCSDVTFKKAAIFVLLQKYLQPVLENFILYDRLVYLKEKGLMNCKFKKIFNEKDLPSSHLVLASFLYVCEKFSHRYLPKTCYIVLWNR